MRRRFFWSILGIATLALVLVGVFGAVVGQVALIRAAEREMAQEATAIGDLLTSQLTDDAGAVLAPARLLAVLRAGELSEGTGTRLRTLLSTAEKITAGRQIDIGWIGPQGTLRLVEHPALADVFRFDVTALEQGIDQTVRRRGTGERQVVLAHAHPIADTRLVVVVYQPSPVLSGQGYFRVMIVGFLIAMILAAVAARLLSKRLAERGAKLASAAQRIAAGDASARTGLTGDDEVADVARAFDEMADKLEATRASEREFLLSVGHDLRTPLTTIGGYAEALEEGGLDEDALERVGGVLTNETRRLRRLIEDLMLLARLEADEFTLRPEEVDVGAYLGAVAEAFRARAERAGITLTVDAGTTGTVRVDPDRLSQIAGNLIENALRHTPEAGTVRFSVSSEGGTLTMDVADTGAGIDAQDIPHVFERFFVSHRYRALRPEGSGLGLSIVQRLVEAMHGTVGVASGETGTVFTVKIPG
jgi:two-component system, OmpR family, sensor kinase